MALLALPILGILAMHVADLRAGGDQLINPGEEKPLAANRAGRIGQGRGEDVARLSNCLISGAR
ncbi:MAG: hypothetical protein KA220_02545 [Phenylobacterium sp.]|nr:hypothetical protein [Phenylobacterium sp.]MBP8246774.1 hypothetical protein [Phenylobacterium sp.]